MYITWADFFQFCLLIVAIIALIFQIAEFIDNKKK